MAGPVDSGPSAGGLAFRQNHEEDVCGPLDLRSLFECHYASIWRLLRRLGVPQAQLDDAAQEVFWVAARRLADIQPGREHPFLYGVALRIASNMIRRSSPLRCSDLEQFPHLVDQRPSPEEQLQQRQLRELLDDVLDCMPSDLRTAFVLHEIEGMEVRHVAELVEIPVGTASSRLRRAREEFSAIAKRARAVLQAHKGCL
jgi:RNA polymerase sigma-70 factor (ECF subfamily)